MNYQILNHLGEVEVASISQEELNTLISDENNIGVYFAYDEGENDLVTRWAQDAAEGNDVSGRKIYKDLAE